MRITGISLRRPSTSPTSPWASGTIVLGHATFCVVVVHNNALARFRPRTRAASSRRPWTSAPPTGQTLRHVILPNIATALLAGGCRPSRYAFDEVIVTTLTREPGHACHLDAGGAGAAARAPVTNVVAMWVVLVTAHAHPGRLFPDPRHGHRAGSGK
jgi:putative spermidine/putrescine transport system permease protein